MGPKDHFHYGWRKETTAKIQCILSVTAKYAALCSAFKFWKFNFCRILRESSNWLFTLFSKPVEVTPEAKMQAYSWAVFKISFRFVSRVGFSLALQKKKFFFFLLFRATLAAYGGSQSRNLIGAIAAGLHHSHSNSGSEPCLWPSPQITATPYPQPTEQGQGLNPHPPGY